MFKTSFLTLTFMAFNLMAENIQAPSADKNPTKLKKHGDTRIDNYFWMKD